MEIQLDEREKEEEGRRGKKKGEKKKEKKRRKGKRKEDFMRGRASVFVEESIV